MKEKKHLNFPVPTEMWEQLVRISQKETKKRGRIVSLSSIIRKAISAYIETEQKEKQKNT